MQVCGLVSRASRVFSLFPVGGAKNMSGHLGQFSMPRRNVIIVFTSYRSRAQHAN